MKETPSSQHDIQADLIRELIQEKRRDRRWKNVRSFAWLFLILIVILLIMSAFQPADVYSDGDGKGYVAFLRLNGMIESGRDFSAEQVVPMLREAFADPRAKGVVLDIDSGGGSPVQASIIHEAILELKKKYHKKVVVVGEDTLASGAYYVAVAADKIYVNPNTLTGSIGVIMKGFGLDELMKKVGIERRVYTSGENKDRLDPFLPQSKEDVDKIKTVIAEVHANFNQVVLAGRAGRLRAAPEALFTGDFWSGQTALKLGLVDALGNLNDVLHLEFNVNRYRDFGSGQSLWKKPFLGPLGSVFSLKLTDHVRVAAELPT